MHKIFKFPLGQAQNVKIPLNEIMHKFTAWYNLLMLACLPALLLHEIMH